MQKMRLSIAISAGREKVWNTLWEDASFRDWASLIDEGTYMDGEFKEGERVQFISSVNGYGITSFIEKLNVHEYVLFKHSADTKESGQKDREAEWTGGQESYTLRESGEMTILTIETDVPSEQVETFTRRLPRVLERIKVLAENGSDGANVRIL